MKLSAYVMLLFAISLSLYLMEFRSPLIYMWEAQGESGLIISCNADNFKDAEGVVDQVAFNACRDNSLINKMISSLTSPESLTLILGIAILGLLTTFIAGFGATYIVPMIILLVFINYIIFPISFVFDTRMPDLIKIPLITFMNIITVLAIVHFVRGGV